MEKKIFEFFGSMDAAFVVEPQPSTVSELSDLQLALVGGGIGDTVL